MDWRKRKDKIQSEGSQPEAGTEAEPNEGAPANQASGMTSDFTERGTNSETHDAEIEFPNSWGAQNPLPVAQRTNPDFDEIVDEPSFPTLSDQPSGLEPFAPYSPAAETKDVDHSEAEPTARPSAEPFPYSIASDESPAYTIGALPMPEVGPTASPADTPEPDESVDVPFVVTICDGMRSTHLLAQEITTVGRTDPDIAHYPDISIDRDDSVSRNHLEIVVRNGYKFVRDVGSTNGTYLRGKKLNVGELTPITAHDTIRLGELTELAFD